METMVNDKKFFSTCGVGFDALVAVQFNEGKSRGLKTYVQNTLQSLFNYKPETYHILGEGIDVTTEAFLITFANAGQWGYDAYIAPKASVQDGLMDIAIVNKFPLSAAPKLALNLFTHDIDENFYMNTVRSKAITLIRENAGAIHIDGDPFEMPKELNIKIVEDGLKVLVKKRF